MQLNRLKKIYILFFFIGINKLSAQVLQKEVRKQEQVWLSINSIFRLTNRWGISVDIHDRRNNFLKDPSFSIIRVGATYWLNDKISITAGYGHMWLAPSKPGWQTFSHENRFYQQIQMSMALGKVNLLQRVRNEQRWQQIIVNDKQTGDNRFTERIRYLLSFNIPVFKNNLFPSLILSDEVCVQFGKEVIYNTFDQNRLFIGIKQKISKAISFDLGYMLLKQQRASGYQYDLNHTLRWFFYYTPDWRKNDEVIH